MPRTVSRPGPLCLLTALGLVILAIGAAEVRAECSPGQKEEAELAYASAYDFLKAGQFEQAVPRLQSVLEICPEHWGTMKALGGAYKQMGKLEDAKTILKRLVQMRGQGADAGDLTLLATVHASLKEYPDARAAYMKAQVLAPEDCSILFNLGILHMAPGVEDYRLAVQTFEEGLDQCPELKDKVMPQLVTACQKAAAKETKTGNPQRAEFYTAKYHDYSGQAGGAAGYDLVKRLMGEKKYAEAVPVLEELVKNDPERPAFLHSLAICYEQSGKDDQAVVAYEKYMAVKPEDERVAASLVMLLAEKQCARAQQLGREYATRFEGRGQNALARLNDAMGMALACSGQHAEAKIWFARAAASNDPVWAPFGREQMQRMDELVNYEAAKKKQQQGG